jgi:hypothetical protein
VSRSRTLVWAGGALAAVAATAGVYAAVSFRGTSPSTTTLMSGWEQRFKLEWTVATEPGRGSRLHGYITSQYGEHAEPVRLLVQAVDASGAVVDRRIWSIPGGVNGFQRAYFEVSDLPAAHTYRVFVWDYTYRQS